VVPERATGGRALHKVAVIVGSIRKESINRKLAEALAKLAEGKLAFQFIRIDDLPLFNQDYANDPPAEVQRFKSEVEACDAVLFVTPEHNRSVPAALKNAFDWGTRPVGKDSWRGKPAAITGASPGRISTAVAQETMRIISAGHVAALLGFPDAFIQYKEGMFAEDGTTTDETTREFLQTFVDNFAKLVNGMAGK
jgi:chromate reductase